MREVALVVGLILTAIVLLGIFAKPNSQKEMLYENTPHRIIPPYGGQASE